MASKKSKPKKVVERIRLTDEQAKRFLAKWAKERDLNGAALKARIEHIAATRLATLERYAAKQG